MLQFKNCESLFPEDAIFRRPILNYSELNLIPCPVGEKVWGTPTAIVEVEEEESGFLSLPPPGYTR